MDTIPWVEKYRPTEFDDIVLDDINKRILVNILQHNTIPNLLFYGPPGTGKTTTIINLIHKYKQIYNYKGKDLVIHLNASDERGIDIIRNQISQFVNTKTLFGKGLKFIILDEVDYMTKNAQQALKHLICAYYNNVRFCLICNYISKIEKCLQDEFLKLRFNQLPTIRIIQFLKNVCFSENVTIQDSKLENIQTYFGSDIRSMINYIQSNQDNLDSNKLLNDDIFKNTIVMINNIDCNHNMKMKIYNLCVTHNIERKKFIKELCYYILRTHIKTTNTNSFYKCVKFVFHHNKYINIDYIMDYMIYIIKGSLLKSNSL